MPTYAIAADLTAYIEGFVITNAAAVDRLLERAERDIDTILGHYSTRNATTGLKITPSTLETWQATALKRATCAQAEYRFLMGEDYFTRAQHASASGPDFSVNGRLPYIGPKVWAELDGSDLLKLTTSMRSPGSRPPWHDFVNNDTSWDYDPPPLPRQT